MSSALDFGITTYYTTFNVHPPFELSVKYPTTAVDCYVLNSNDFYFENKIF